MNELGFQRELVKEMKSHKGFGWKMSHQHFAGVPDLCLIHPDYPICIAECKMIKTDKVFDGKIIPIKTTQLQKVFLRKVQMAGGMAGVILLLEVEKQWPQYLFITADIDMPHFKFNDHPCIRRKRGEPWYVKALIHSIHQHQMKLYQPIEAQPTEIISTKPKSKLILN